MNTPASTRTIETRLQNNMLVFSYMIVVTPFSAQRGTGTEYLLEFATGQRDGASLCRVRTQHQSGLPMVRPQIPGLLVRTVQRTNSPRRSKVLDGLPGTVQLFR